MWSMEGIEHEYLAANQVIMAAWIERWRSKSVQHGDVGSNPGLDFIRKKLRVSSKKEGN